MSLANPLAAGLPPIAAEQLPDDLATLKRMVLELLASLQERQRDYEALRHRLDLLLRRLYGPRGERFDPNQPLLFAEMVPSQDAAAAAAPTEPAAVAEPKRRCKPHGRRRLPESLPREPRHYELSEAERVCQDCGRIRIDIGVDKSEQLDYRPASLIVIEHIVHKYVCPCCSRQPTQAQVQQAHLGQESEPMPARPAEFQPPPPSAEPTPTPGPTDNSREQVSSSQQATEQRQRSPAPTPPCQLVDPSEVVIVAPEAGPADPQGAAGTWPFGSPHRQQVHRSPAAASPGAGLPAARSVLAPLDSVRLAGGQCPVAATAVRPAGQRGAGSRERCTPTTRR